MFFIQTVLRDARQNALTALAGPSRRRLVKLLLLLPPSTVTELVFIGQPFDWIRMHRFQILFYRIHFFSLCLPALYSFPSSVEKRLLFQQKKSNEYVGHPIGNDHRCSRDG